MSLAFLAFLLTFLITRTITRMIRAGKGPFHDNVVGGVHIHHAIPGIILTITGAFGSVAVVGRAPGAEVFAVMIGIGSSLVLDEFAMLLHLSDVYWTKQGQLSVQVVLLTVALLGLVLLGVDPLSTAPGIWDGHIAIFAVLPIHIVLLLVCVQKGKYSTAAIGAFIPPVSWYGALRLARPGSRWARRFYRDRRLERARRHDEAFNRQFGRWRLTLEDLVAGRPTQPDLPAGQSTGATTGSSPVTTPSPSDDPA